MPSPAHTSFQALWSPPAHDTPLALVLMLMWLGLEISGHFLSTSLCALAERTHPLHLPHKSNFAGLLIHSTERETGPERLSHFAKISQLETSGENPEPSA